MYKLSKKCVEFIHGRSIHRHMQGTGVKGTRGTGSSDIHHPVNKKVIQLNKFSNI